ncbi:uncharacterized protein LOC120350904 [Nilaparvata lugens]|uniref:uncharacterized protein LOC120350904 n=1 Tax=Nilaparvata lugens TaxID=108931 RepID=UPI00193CD5B0|nr:uncharacterized protein LOC120350904 [Nilaparvata lugens]
MSHKMVFLNIYRAPNSNFEVFIELLRSVLSRVIRERRKLVCLCGDFNIDFLKEDRNKKLFENLLSTFKLNKLTDGPTRITRKTASEIDYIISNYPQTLCSSEIIPCSFTDHEGSSVKFGLEKPKSNYKKYVKPKCGKRKCFRVIDTPNINALNDGLSKETWHAVYDSNNVENMFDNFMSSYINHCNSSVPEKSVSRERKRDQIPWITPGIRISSDRMKTLNCLVKTQYFNDSLIYIKTNTGFRYLSFEIYYKIYKSIYKKVLKVAKKKAATAYIKNSSNQVRAIWKFVRLESAKNQELTSDMCIANEIGNIKRGKEAADILNNYFINAPLKIQNSLLEKNDIWDYRSVFNMNLKSKQRFSIFKPLSCEELKEIIKSLKNKKSCDCFNISNFQK